MTKDILWRSLEVTPTHKIFDGKCVVVYVQKPYFFFMWDSIMYFLTDYKVRCPYSIAADCVLWGRWLTSKPDSRFLSACVQATKDVTYPMAVRQTLKLRLNQLYGIAL